MAFECSHDDYIYWFNIFESQSYLMRHIELFSRVCGSDIVETVLKQARDARTDLNLSEGIKADTIALEDVITSYSIHYTKLYDARGDFFAELKQRVAVPTESQIETGIAAQHQYLQEQIIPLLAELGFVITSYSIHYTKLYDSAWATKADDTLVYASDSAPENISLYHNNVREGVILAHLIWDTLVYRDPNTGKYEPMLATAWKWDDDKHISFDLRKDVKFQNGDVFSADDVVFTFNYALAPESKIVTLQNVDWIEKVEKVDDYKVQFTLKKSYNFV